MQRFRLHGLILCLLGGICFLATFPVIPLKETVTLAGDFPAEIKLSYPRRVFLGQSANVKVHFVSGTEITQILPTVLVAHFESIIEEILPSGELQAVIQSGKPLSLSWKIKPFQVGRYKSTIWISALVAGDEQLLLAREIEIETDAFFMTRAENIRIVFGFVSGIGVVVFLLGLGHRKD